MNKHQEYESASGLKYFIHHFDDGRYQLWSWHNKPSGWTYRGDFPTYEEAFAELTYMHLATDTLTLTEDI